MHCRLRIATMLAFAAAGLLACSPGSEPTAPRLPDADTRILFVGNSLTYVNDLPALLATIADVLGEDIAVSMIAEPNHSLEDHWRRGVAVEIRRLAPDVLVMQQGPSSLPQNQLHLRSWADSLARVGREVGATPALLMVWPSSDRAFAFDDVRAAYLGAAEGVDGHFVPAGEAWRRAWDDEPGLALWGPDGFHPSQLGSVLAALTLARTLFGTPLAGLPARLEPDASGLPTITMGEATAETLYRAADEAVTIWGREPGAAPAPRR